MAEAEGLHPVTEERAHLGIALLQNDPVLGEVETNLTKLHEQLRQVRGSDVAVAPELALHGYHLSALREVDSLALDDPRLLTLGEHHPAVIAGFVERRRHDQSNSAAVIDGRRVRVQRKLFLPTYRSWEEGKHFRAGSRLRHFELRGTRVGVLICNDLWQPPLPWLAVQSGAEVLVVIANSVHSEAAVPVQTAWDLLIRHAAVTLQCYVVFVNRVGTENGAQFWGGSRVVGPGGEELARLGDEPATAQATLDLQALRVLRREWPLLREPRLDLVGREIAALMSDED
jgi:predicted amidohydrolase